MRIMGNVVKLKGLMLASSQLHNSTTKKDGKQLDVFPPTPFNKQNVLISIITLGTEAAMNLAYRVLQFTSFSSQ